MMKSILAALLLLAFGFECHAAPMILKCTGGSGYGLALTRDDFGAISREGGENKVPLERQWVFIIDPATGEARVNNSAVEKKFNDDASVILYDKNKVMNGGDVIIYVINKSMKSAILLNGVSVEDEYGSATVGASLLELTCIDPRTLGR